MPTEIALAEPAKSEAAVEPIWTGFLVPGQITLLTGMWKIGKTTLLSHLLAHRREGGTLLDRPVRPGTTVLVSEEDRSMWAHRNAKLGFGPNLGLFCRPFQALPTMADFLALMDRLMELRASRGVDLVVFDPIALLLPIRNENSAVSMHRAVAPLRRLTDAGVAVLLSHHPSKKGIGKERQSSRGSGALTGFADILLELRLVSNDLHDRRRTLHCYSRNEGTPPVTVIELNREGTEYRVLPEESLTELPDYWPILQAILRDAPGKRTRKEILAEWGDDVPPPRPLTLWRWLDALCERELLVCEGSGNYKDPYRYGLAAKASGTQ
jgi:hypothetical protein